jgi:hypothetical protein
MDFLIATVLIKGFPAWMAMLAFMAGILAVRKDSNKLTLVAGAFLFIAVHSMLVSVGR